MMWRTVSQLCAVAVQILANYFSFRKSRFAWLFALRQPFGYPFARNVNFLKYKARKSDSVFEFIFEGRRVGRSNPYPSTIYHLGGTNDVLLWVLCGLHSLSHTHPSARHSSWRLWQYLHFSIWLNAVLSSPSCPRWTLIVPLSTTRSN